MEQQPETITGAVAGITAIHNDKKTIVIQDSHNQVGHLPIKKKRSGPLHVLKAAMQMLRLKTGKSKSTKVQAATAWKSVVGSMRPLHLQGNQTPPRLIEAGVVPYPVQPKPNDDTAIVEEFEASTPSSSSASSSSVSASRYASANDLQELWRKESQLEDKDDSQYEEEEDEEDRYYDDKRGDDMIDYKAEEFIARFYEQMRLQRLPHGNKNKQSPWGS